MKVLRLWYRGVWVEPIILGLCATMVVTGVALVAHYTRMGGDRFRTLQMAAGAYFVAFLPPHIYAVLGSRSAHVETDWIFAQGGPQGLLASRVCDLIPYYMLAVFFLVMHASLGLRVVLLKHGVKESIAARAFNAIATSGGVAALLILAALLGLQLGS
jgi:succinate dehydrogenase hydrophobic anchor subunit